MAKIEKKSVYSAIDEVEGYKEQLAEAQANFMTIDDFGDDINNKSDTTAGLKDKE